MDIIHHLFHRHIIKLSMINVVYTNLQRADALQQCFLQICTDTHNLAGSLHLCAQQVGCSRKLIKGESGQLCDHIIQLRLKSCICVGDLDILQCHAYRNLCSHTSNGIAGCLGCQRRRAGNARVDLDQVVLTAVRIQCKLHITAAFDLQLANDLNSRIIEHFLVMVAQGHNRCHNNRVTGMHTNRIHIFHATDGNSVVVSVAHNFKFDFLIALNALLDQDLMHRRKLKCIQADLLEFFFIVSKATACTTQGKCRT